MNHFKIKDLELKLWLKELEETKFLSDKVAYLKSGDIDDLTDDEFDKLISLSYELQELKDKIDRLKKWKTI